MDFARAAFRAPKPGRLRSGSVPLVGLGRFELPTSPLSGVRSNQLSYRPPLSGIVIEADWTRSAQVQLARNQKSEHQTRVEIRNGCN